MTYTEGGGGGGEGNRGVGALENRGREGYGRRERKGQEVGVPKGREVGEIGENYGTLHNISQSKKGKREEAKKKGAGAGIARYGKREVWAPLSPPPPYTGVRLWIGVIKMNTEP